LKGTGKDEPIAFTTRFGQGRCFNLLLGHDAIAMDAAGFQELLCCGMGGDRDSFWRQKIKEQKHEAKSDPGFHIN
jgi:type 1 glutamine amidotransferase